MLSSRCISHSLPCRTFLSTKSSVNHKAQLTQTRKSQTSHQQSHLCSIRLIQDSLRAAIPFHSPNLVRKWLFASYPSTPRLPCVLLLFPDFIFLAQRRSTSIPFSQLPTGSLPISQQEPENLPGLVSRPRFSCSTPWAPHQLSHKNVSLPRKLFDHLYFHSHPRLNPLSCWGLS